MVPCSSKIEKFEKLILKKQSENKPTDSVRIIKIFGKKSVLLFQDISTDALILLQKNPTKHITFSPVIHSVGYHNPIYNDSMLFKQPALLLQLRGNSLHCIVKTLQSLFLLLRKLLRNCNNKRYIMVTTDVLISQ